MRIFSTCRGCGHLLMVAIGEETVNTNVHEGRCVNARPTRRESLVDNLNLAERDYDEMAEAAAIGGMLPSDEAAADSVEVLIADLKSQLADLDRQPPRLLDAAVKYAEWGWRVFPLAPRTKRPAIPNAHPEGDPLRGHCKGECGKIGHGVHDAHSDIDRIKRRWTKFPNDNIGLATGYLFDVIDVDPPKKPGAPDGREQIPKILASEELPDAHGVVYTRSGGLHYYIKATGEGNTAGILPGVDYRGKGGYVVAPPSLLSQDERWFWSIAASPEIHQ